MRELWSTFVSVHAAVIVSSCGVPSSAVEGAAETYVELAFSLDHHDPDYVDAYLGGSAAPAEVASLENIEQRARRLSAGLKPVSSLRARRLSDQLSAVAARARILSGGAMSFDEELERLYAIAAPPRLTKDRAAPILARLDLLLPGAGTLAKRYASFEARALVPAERLGAVAAAAVTECRARTVQHVALPPGEAVTIELVRGKPWASYHRYQGGYRSVVQINREVAWTVPGVVEAVCHESYPGHHFLTVLSQVRLVEERGWREHEVQSLRSPRQALMERLANAGVTLLRRADTWPGVERELFTVAGLDPELAAVPGSVDVVARELRPFLVEGARRYLDGELDRVAAAIWLESVALVADPWAFLRFVDRYGSYVAAYVDSDTITDWDELEARWLGTPDAT